MAALKETFTAQELAQLLSRTDRAIQMRAEREGWASRPRAGRGGGHEWLVASMPEPTRAALTVALARQAEAAAPPVARVSDVVVPDWAWRVARARYRVVAEWRATIVRQKARGMSGKGATEAFLAAYRSGTLLPREVVEAAGEVSRPTLYRWDKALREAGEDMEVLADKRGGWANGRKKGLGQIGPDAEAAFLAAYLTPNRPSMTLAYRAMELVLQRQGLDVPSYASVRRFFERFDSYHHDLVVLRRDGEKALADKVGAYLNRDDRILRVGDVLFADGHVLNFDVLHPETGKPCRMTLIGWQDWASRMPVGWEIMPTENTVAVSAALRMSILNLGKCPQVVYLDNGKAFKNKFFSERSDLAELDGLYVRLGIDVVHSLPYQGRTKVIERFWRSFNEECARILPSYRGRCIDDKPAHLHRNERWHKARHNEWVPTVDDVGRILALYVEWHAQREHPTRPGRSIREVFDEGRGPGFSEAQQADLDRHFLWRREVTPRRCRITIAGVEFESDALYGVNKRLTAMFAWSDLSEVRLYDDGRYIATARPVASLNPLAKHFGDKLDMDSVAAANKRVRQMKRDTVRLARELDGRAAEALGGLPWMQPAQERRTPLTVVPARGAMPAAQDRRMLPEAHPTPDMSEAEAQELRAALEDLTARQAARPEYEAPAFFANAREKYEFLFEVSVGEGKRLTPEDARFMADFEQSPDYKPLERRYAQLRAIYANDHSHTMEAQA